MNILIQFEDENGCTSLFETSNIFRKIRNNITVKRGLGNSGVYKVGKKKALSFDRIIIVFDLDALSTKNIKDTDSLTVESFIDILKENGIVNEQSKVAELYKDKIAFMPVEFCYETINLYSEHLIEVLRNIEKYNSNQNTEILKVLKEYYNYTDLHPEYFEGASNIAEEIHEKICKIRNESKGRKWEAQQIHLAFSKNLLTLYFRENGYSIQSDKICEKKESKLFLEMIKQNTKLQPSNIIDDFYAKADINKLFARLLMCNNEQELEEICKDASLEHALYVIDKYNNIVKRDYKRKEASNRVNDSDAYSKLSACKTNIDIMLGNDIKSIKTIRNNLRNMGFDDTTINEAIDNLSVI